MCGTCGCSTPQTQKEELTSDKAHEHSPSVHTLELEQQILAHNDHMAAHNREDFAADDILAINLVSSPGSGKTTLLETTLKRLVSTHDCSVIEGDQQTDNDARRIAATGVAVKQVNTGTGCHLEAEMIRGAVKHLAPEKQSLLFIENVGNLVCPALFDLGEYAKVAILSVTEGEDKPLKYPHMFRASSLMLINKIDLLPYVEFDVEKCIAYARQVNPDIAVLQVSATKETGIDGWITWLEQQQTILATQDVEPHVHTA